jgi:hypothetical protein
MGEDIDIEARADRVIHHYGHTLAVGELSESRQVCRLQKRVAWHFTENSGEFLLLQKFIEALKVGIVPAREKLHP